MKGIRHLVRTKDHYIKLFGAACLLLMLGLTAGCGDDAFTGESAATTSSTTTQVTNPTTGASVATIQLLTSTPSLGSSPTDSVDISAIVKDTNNNLMSGVDVIFSSNGGDLTVTQSQTSSTGVAAANLTTASDPTNRTITVTATAGNISSSVQIDVTGTIITVSGATSLVFGDSTTLTIFVRDSDGQGLTSQTVNVASAQGNTLSAASVTTDATGRATVNVSGTQGGTDTITISGLGASATFSINVSNDQFTFTAPATTDLDIGTPHTVTVNWVSGGTAVAGSTVTFSATRGTLSSSTAVTDGSGNATVTITSDNAGPSVVTATTTTTGPTASRTVEFIATTPNALDLQADRTTIGPNGEQAALTAVVRDPTNNLVKNQNVVFSIVQDNSGGQISNSTDTTDSQGRASTVYSSTSATTAKDGVVIQAKIEGADCIATPALCDTVRLTVAQNELFVRLGTGNDISNLDIRYSYPYTVLVTDSGGNAVANASVVITLIPTIYHTGWLSWSDTVSAWFVVPKDSCTNEDLNLDGILDQGEDVNNNGTLEPRNVASVAGTVTTDANGFGLFDIVYAKEYALWTNVALTATVGVAGTESAQTVTFRLPASVDDLKDQSTPPSYRSPFGAMSTCTQIRDNIPYNVIAAFDPDTTDVLVSWNLLDNASTYNVYWTTVNPGVDPNNVIANQTGNDQGVRPIHSINGLAGGGTTYYLVVTANIIGNPTVESEPSDIYEIYVP
ncbi:Ig-like domain-containing protein [Kaarinaea lacus]